MPYFPASGIVKTRKFVSSRWSGKLFFFSLPVARGPRFKSLQLSSVAFLLLKLVISPFVAYKIGKRLSEQMCSFSTTANALDFLSVPHEWFSHRTAAAFYGRRTMHHHLWQLNCHAQSHNNRQYGDKVLTQPLLPKNIMHPSRMHWLVIYWEVCHCLLSAKSMASNGLWKWPQNRWIWQEGKRT